MRFTILMVYCLALFIGTALIVARNPQDTARLVAARDLAAGRLLQPSDFAPMSSGSQYLTRNLKKNEALKAGDIDIFPPVQFANDELPLVFRISRASIAQDVNAAEKVQICQQGKLIFQPATVKAVFCPPAGAECAAIATVPLTAVDTAVKALGSGIQVSLQPHIAGSTCN